ncbi:MAG TPA: ergothioneine biosynthesis protein EgtB [Cryomorphaceae bacterium]|nr:sulfatase maturase [Owenweeksia sp.]MBF97532.1 sulfatase maturase [Owenweeksia sp.]HAD96083.1 ergothioneine biosynthesis protein EgtB [Cryomorphaceae bacterium]HBF20008.1 ergothioneine biosynthesis protein EgtB [Cryomorphaceae bacterium]HCQ17001.1 ergothioneine biosynthesis protein EgtB [Cryomorphaceae bacterium]
MSLREKYKTVRQHTEDLLKPLSTEDHLAQPMMDVSPPKWHLGHTTWFFETFILKNFLEDYQEFDPTFNFLFNSYYETVGKRLVRDQRGNMTRPPLENIYQYRAYVNQQMDVYLSGDPDPKSLELLELGLNHEQQHQELFLTDFKYILGVQPFYPVYREDFEESKVEKGKQEWIQVWKGTYRIGFKGNGFCFDNEKGRHQVFLHDFEISNKLVTNGEYLEFIEAGGYRDFRYWHSEGWAWVQENQVEAPLYWEKSEGKWQHFTLAGLKDINPDEPLAHISYYEAYAYAEWKGLRLPTEQEWEAANELFKWGQRWEWTNSAYLAYPGFKKEEGAVGEYNGKFMVNQMVLRGASVATPEGHSRPTYRNFFHPHLRWQFTGLRLAR